MFAESIGFSLINIQGREQGKLKSSLAFFRTWAATVMKETNPCGVLTTLLREGYVDQGRLPCPFLFTLIKGDRLCLFEEELVKLEKVEACCRPSSKSLSAPSSVSCEVSHSSSSAKTHHRAEQR
jgi:hypothetical protein